MAANELPPFSLEAETGVIGSMLISPSDCVPVAGRNLRANQFRHPAHETIFALILAMFAEGVPADTITLTQRLREMGKLDAVGGAAIISGFITATPTSANLEYYIEIVREDWQRFQAWKACRKIEVECLNPNPGAIQSISADLTRLAVDLSPVSTSGHRTWAEHVQDRLEFYERESTNQGEPEEVFSTGIIGLDKELGGGFVLGDYIVISGVTSGGKSALAQQIATHVSMQYHTPVMIASYEMRAKHLVDRAIARAASINSARLRMGKIDGAEFDRLAKNILPLTGAKIHIREKIGRWTMDDLASEARAIKAQHGLTLMVVDYLQLVPSRQRGMNREREVAEGSRALIELAQELNIILIALSQQNKDGELRESKAIGHDADVSILIENTDPTDKHKRILRSDKARHGERDWSVTVNWFPSLSKFS